MKARDYLVTVKQGSDVLKQSKLAEPEAFKLLHNVIESVYNHSSSADIALMYAKEKLSDGKAITLEYNGRTMVFQSA